MTRFFRFLTAVLCAAAFPASRRRDGTPVADLAPQAQVGDVVFIRVTARPFLESGHGHRVVDQPRGHRRRHVGPRTRDRRKHAARVRHDGLLALRGPLEHGRVAVARPRALSADEQRGVRAAAARRHGVRYDTGFDLHSQGQFCSGSCGRCCARPRASRWARWRPSTPC